MSTWTSRPFREAWRRHAGRYYRNPAAYWEARHREHRGRLCGPGCIGLDEPSNQHDYDTKWLHLEPLLEAERRAGARRLLDAGCGIGWFTARASDMGFVDVAAADFSATAAAATQRLVPGCRVSVCSLHEVASDAPYDVVMSIDVLFHIVDNDLWARSVANLGSLTRAQGALIVQDCIDTASESAPASHVRHRSLADYLDVLAGWSLEVHDTYELPEQQVRKDMLVFRRPLGE